MTYKIHEIEGIGTHFAERLVAAGVTTSDQLRTRCATDEGRRALAIRADVTIAQLMSWVHQADLMRVSGIGAQYGQLLEHAGIETVAELGIRKPENIVNLLTRVNEQKRLTRAVPSLGTVAKWVTRAREMSTSAGAGSVAERFAADPRASY